MPGRQAHGRSLLAQPKAKSAPKRSKARAQKTALNAFNIAQEQFPTKTKRTPRARELDAEIERKHARDEGDDEGDEAGDDGEGDDDERGPKRKKVKGAASRGSGGGDGVEFGSDSEGNEWQLGGMAEDDEDSEIESDEAFGESDNEMFQGYAFRGSRAQRRKDDDCDDDSDDSNDDVGETLGEEAIDLATALDQFEEESDEAQAGEGASGSDEEEEEDDDDDEDEDEDEDDSEADDESDQEADPERLKELQGLISGFGGQIDAKDKDGSSAPRSQKIDLSDLGLMGLSDPSMKRSVRLMKKEEKGARPGASKKLDVPLSRREQGRLDRSAAYDKTNEALDRWTETVKANRRAEHLVFPLPQESESHGVDRGDIALVSAAGGARNELEAAVLSIMEQSGLSMEKERKKKAREVEYDEEGNALSRKQVLERRRLERELNSREARRAKRIKKIKSKAYHRVHRKQRERDEMAAQEARAEAGEVDSEEEREAHDRRRALERVGQRHKDSKWAKLGSKTKRAVWDDDFRAGLTEMARRDDELRRRKEGKGAAGGEDDSDDTSSSGSDESDGDEGSGRGTRAGDKLRRKLDELEREEDTPQSRLMSMKFMQKAEAAQKKANDELIKQIRRDLDAADGADADADADGAHDSADEERGNAGRRQYGNAGAENPFSMPKSNSGRSAHQKAGSASKDKKNSTDDDDDDDEDDAIITVSKKAAAPAPETVSSVGGAWSRGDPPRRKHAPSRSEALPLDEHILTASAPASTTQPKSKSTRPSSTGADAKRSASNTKNDDDDDTSDSDSDSDSNTTAHKHAGPINSKTLPNSSKSSSSKNKTKTKNSSNDNNDSPSDSDSSNHLPLAIRDRALIARAFAADDVLADFAREKAAVAADDDDKVVDNTLPGWGSWVGEGVSAREKKRHAGRFLTKIEGVKQADRKDAKLERVIINEKRVKKNDRYLASQLPHMFESRHQYERSLRLPVGPEWMTKETFQDSTKPRVLIKQGVIAPMSRPSA